LPLLVALYRSVKDDQKAGRRHKTTHHLLRQLCCLLLRWFRQRTFVLAGDGDYASHELACFCVQQRGQQRGVQRRRLNGRLHLVSKFYR
jgi:hypothetical protein